MGGHTCQIVSKETVMDRKELQRRVDELSPWHYCHIFPYGISTGDSPVPVQSEKLKLLLSAGALPADRYRQVLDLGANSGLISMWFVDNKGSTVMAVENSAQWPNAYEQLELAVEVKGYTSKVLPVEADMTEPFLKEGAEFDLVLNLGVLHHIPQPKHSVVYDLMCSALKPGGLIVIQTKNDQKVLQRLRQAGFKKIKQVAGYAQGDRLAWTATR